MKKIIWLFVIVLIALSCYQFFITKRAVEASGSSDAAYKDLQTRFSDTLKDYADYRAKSQTDLDNATATAVQNGEIAEQSKSELNQKNQQINTLLLILDSVDKRTPDSSWVRVDPTYKWGCDSLRRANILQGTMIGQYERDNQAHVDALNYETQIRDSALQKERLFSKVFQDQLVSCMKALDQSEKSKRRIQLYAGMAAWGNSLTPLGGGEINLGLKTKSDQFYEIKGAYIGQWWVGIGTKFKITLK